MFGEGLLATIMMSLEDFLELLGKQPRTLIGDGSPNPSVIFDGQGNCNF